jgi:hypothetical protein
LPILRVFAHWSTAPAVPSPNGLSSAFPAQFSSYPAAPPPSIGGPPGPPLYTLWAELARQTDIDAVGWSGPAWPGPQPPGPDQGYDPAAVGFEVSRVRIVGVGGPVGPDFVYTVRPPGGQPAFTLSPPNYTQTFAPPFDGSGIWIIEVNYAPGSAGTASSELQGPPAVLEPYFSPYGASAEGICAVQFEGKEIYGTTTTTTTSPPTTTTTSTTTTPPPCCYQVSLPHATPACSSNAPVSHQFVATVVPHSSTPNCPPYSGDYTWTLYRRAAGSWQQLHTITQQSNVYTYPSGFLPGDYKVEVVIDTPACNLAQNASASDEFFVKDCDCPTITGLLQATQDSTNPCRWEFSVFVNNPKSDMQVTWDFGDGTTVNTGTAAFTDHTYATSGQFTVTVTVTRASVSRCNHSIQGQVNVDCPGPTTSTTPGPTTTSTTTGAPPPTSTTSSTTTGGPTTSTSTTSSTTTPDGGGMGCFCIILLVLALAFIAFAAVAFLAWACTGFGNVALLVAAVVAAILGLIFLILWILLCARAACDVLFFLIDMFTVLVAVMPIVALIFFLLKLPNCSLGALLDAGYFALVLSILYRGGELVGCIVRAGDGDGS